MPISHVASTTASAFAVANISKPPGLVSGDVMVMVVGYPNTHTLNIPSGWTLIRTEFQAQFGKMSALYRVAGASEPASTSLSLTNNGYLSACLSAFRGASASAPIDAQGFNAGGGASTSITIPSVTTSSAGAELVALLLSHADHPSASNIAPAAGYTERIDAATTNQDATEISSRTALTAGATGAATATTAVAGNNAAILVALRPGNQPPNAPILTGPTSSATIDRGITQRFSWNFSDPDAGDSQSQYDLGYRQVGAGTWTTVTDPTPNTFRDFAAGTFAAGDYEWQVSTYDAQGVQGPWSASGFFTAADAPAAPTITAPTSGATVSSASATVTWSTPNQDAYQVQVLDGSTVVSDTGQVTSSTTRSITQEFPTNNVARTIQVRVRYGGLWSQWYTISVAVSYTPPPVPSVTLTASGTALIVQVTNPAPGAGEPTVVQNDVYVTEAGTEQRRAIVTPNGTWTYRTPRSGIDYDPLVRIEAIGDNGTRSSS